MSLMSRRKLLQGLALSLPTVWSRPVVESIVIPTHAQATSCSAPAGCINVSEGSFRWPGSGQLGEAIDGWEGQPNCPTSVPGEITIVLASSQSEAQSLCGGGSVQQLTNPNPAPTDGCEFWLCGPVQM